MVGEVRDAKRRVTGQLPSYSRAEEYGFAVKRGAEGWSFAMTEFLDTDEKISPKWKIEE